MKRRKSYPIITANGLAFAHARTAERDIPGEVTGLYDVRRGGVLLTERDGSPIALACGNDDSGRAWRGSGFFVTVSRHEDRLWFAYSTTTQTQHRLGLQRATASQEQEIAHALLDQARELAPRWNRPSA